MTNYSFVFIKRAAILSFCCGNIQDTECNKVHNKDSQQEWVFTLYNLDDSGKVTKEVACLLDFGLNRSIFKYLCVVCLTAYVLQDMSCLIHSMYEVLDTSVRQPCSHTPLNIKLCVTPSACPDKILEIGEITFSFWLEKPTYIVL